MSQTSPQSPPTINELWYTRCPVPTASGIALDIGWLQWEFARDGIVLSSVREADSGNTRLAHFNHRLPGLFREGGNIPAIWARASGVDTAVVALTWVDEFQAILAQPNGSIRTIADLRGKRVAVPRQNGARVDFARAMSWHGIISALDLAGLTASDIEPVDILTGQTDLRDATANATFHAPEISALREGHVDAAYVKGAVGAGVAREYGLHVIVDLGQHPDPMVRVNNGNPRPVTVDRRTAAERPDLVARYLATLMRAASWARQNPDDVAQIVAREVGRSVADVAAGYGPNLTRSFGLDLSPLRRRALEAQKDFLLRWGYIPADFGVEGWIDPLPFTQAQTLLEEFATAT